MDIGEFTPPFSRVFCAAGALESAQRRFPGGRRATHARASGVAPAADEDDCPARRRPRNDRGYNLGPGPAACASTPPIRGAVQVRAARVGRGTARCCSPRAMTFWVRVANAAMSPASCPPAPRWLRHPFARGAVQEHAKARWRRTLCARRVGATDSLVASDRGTAAPHAAVPSRIQRPLFYSQQVLRLVLDGPRDRVPRGRQNRARQHKPASQA